MWAEIFFGGEGAEEGEVSITLPGRGKGGGKNICVYYRVGSIFWGGQLKPHKFLLWLSYWLESVFFLFFLFHCLHCRRFCCSGLVLFDLCTPGMAPQCGSEQPL